MAKSEGTAKTPKAAKPTPSPQQPKPRLRFVKTVMLTETMAIANPSASYTRGVEGCEIVADLDAQIMTIRRPGKPTYCVPFSRCKHWIPDVGVPSE